MNLSRLVLIATGVLFACGSVAQTPCESGFAGAYPCDNVDLMSHLNGGFFGANANDIWGWVDPVDDHEYVLLGLSNGTAFIDITDPVNPIYVGHLPTETSNSSWRDIKVYSDHAFIVSEAGGHGMQVFDLTQLSSVVSPPATFSPDAHYSGFGNAHNIAINEATGMAYAVGTNTFSGGLHIVDVTSPLTPVIAGDFALDGYTHDTQVVIYNGPDTDYAGQSVAFSCNEDELTIANVEDPSDTYMISSTGYANASYAHQGWLTPDHKYFLLSDELDENNGTVSFTTTYIWDVQDLDAPFLMGEHTATTAAIDHNLYTDGNLVFQSNYRAGLRILDAIDIANTNLTEVAYFDVYPANDNTGFSGTWSNYPYFPSGIVAVSHITDGVFILKPTFTKISPDDQTLCDEDDAVYDIELIEGFEGPIALSVNGIAGVATASFSANNVTAPTTVQLTLSDLDMGAGPFSFDVVATGAHFSYTVSASCDPTPAPVWYQDGDDDGFGNAAVVLSSCIQPAGYVADDTDCDDIRNDVYPGAPGTAEGIDNNCNGSIDVDEELPCLADFDDDGIRAVSDLLVILADFGCTSGCVADLTGDDITNSADILVFLSLFGTNCP
jgi:choice-of-anchor B domain-containing protein